jgi:PAS domain S-box-containing protein
MGQRSDGSEFPVEVTLTLIPAADRNILLSSWRDIRRRKIAEFDRSAAEEALLNQTEILTSILNKMGDAVIVADKNYRFLIFNPAAEQMFGAGATETKAEGWSRTYGLYLPDEVTPFPPEELPLARAIRGEEVHNVEVFVRHDTVPDGLWARVSGRSLRDAKGELSGGVIVCRDMTERKREDAFRAGQGRVLEMIARGQPLAEVLESLVLLIEAQSDDMLCSVLQLSDDGKHIRSGAAPGLPDIYVRAVDGAPIGPKNGSCGTAMYLAKQIIVTDMLEDPLWEDYRELVVLSGMRACWSTPILSGSGKVLGSFAMYYRDPQTPSGTEARLTEVATHIAGIAIEHHRASDELRRTQAELAHVSRVTTMGELAASIAHEVNQPLGAIVGNADICLQWLGDTQPDLAQLREAIEDIASDGRRASEVIARIRSLVKKSAPEKTPLDLSAVAREVLDLVAHEAHRRQVALTCYLGGAPSMVKGDRVQLQQVLLNLLMNGIEAMTNMERGKPELTVQITKSDSGEVLTAVRDSGPGIKPEEAEQLFKPFHTTKSAGMGMGLAISRSIVEAHGGRLWIEETEGPGAMFKFTLPAVKGGP